MFKKVICLFLIACVLGVQSAHLIAAPAAAIINARSELAEDAETDSHPQYSFTYSVNDVSTGDHKSQTETRDGDFVSGQYTLAEPDGSIRQVDYTADAVNGFNAHVKKIAPAKFIAAAPVVAAPAKIIAQPAIVQPTKYIAAAPAKFIAQPAYVAAAPAKLVASAPIVAHHSFAAPIVAAPARYAAYSAPIVSHAPLTAAYHAAPYYPSASYVAHNPFAYHAPAAYYHH